MRSSVIVLCGTAMLIAANVLGASSHADLRIGGALLLAVGLFGMVWSAS